MNRRVIAASAVGLLTVAAVAVAVFLTSTSEEYPGWETVGDVDGFTADPFVAGVGNGRISIVPASRVGDESRERGVAVTDDDTGEVTFASVPGADQGCLNSPDVAVGPAGFVYRTLVASGDGGCTASGGTTILSAISADGVDWQPVPDPTGAEDSYVIAARDDFVRVSNEGVTDALTGDDITVVPWSDTFVPIYSAGSSDGEIVVLGRDREASATDPDEFGWVMSAAGDWAPVEPPPAWRKYGQPQFSGDQFGTLQSSDDGFRLVWNAHSQSLVARSDDGLTWTVDDTGILAEEFYPRTEVLYSSPERTLVRLDVEVDASLPWSTPYCFTVTEPCDGLPDRLFIEITDDAVVELRSDDPVPPEREPYSSVDRDGLYSRLLARDRYDDEAVSVDVLRMEGRDEGALSARFDRRPLDDPTCPEDIEAEQVDIVGQLIDDGEALAFPCSDEGLWTRVQTGQADLDDLRTATYSGEDAEYTMFTAERVADRLTVYAYPTDTVFGIYEVETSE